ncbi:MAG: phosphoenolpyruvate--protein phosphotransferase [Pseudomonadota bacterium]
MQGNRGKEPSIISSEPALRVVMRRLRAIMADEGDGQSRLDKIVRQIAGVMIAEVCSIYVKRRDGSLELFATEGLNADAPHNTRLKRGEGLVGRCAELNEPMNEPDAQAHPAFSYRPETGEEAYKSFLAVPVQRAGQVLGVLVVQNHTQKEYSDEDVEVLQATAMVLAELLGSGTVAGSDADVDGSKSQNAKLSGEPIADGIALGHVVFHEPRIVVTQLLSDDPEAELARIDDALTKLRTSLDEMFSEERLMVAGEHRDVLEAYRMFANDRGWVKRLREATQGGLTAEAAIERVQNTTRARMLRQSDPYWRERVRDLDDLSDRLMRIVAGRKSGADNPADLPDDTILVARTMGPAELLDYDRTKLRGLVVEDGSGQSHVAIVAKALGIAAVGQAGRAVEHADTGDAIIVDAESGEIHLRPSFELVSSYTDKVRLRAKRQQRYDALRDKPAVTKDGIRIALQINAGLLVDMPHVAQSGADGVGLFRTELQFMLADRIPRTDAQAKTYRAVMGEAAGRPVVFRALDIGGDKILPYLRPNVEENPAIGWRAIRMSLDREGLFRMQVRAFLRACAGDSLNLMIPMVTTSAEMDLARAVIDKEIDRAKQKGGELPAEIKVGAMLEVPNLLFELEEFLPRVDFISVGSNDLMQFLLAADRTNSRVGNRYDVLSPGPLRALQTVNDACERHDVPLTICGEMAGSPIEALALVGLGFRSLSMGAGSIGPVKSMVLTSNTAAITEAMENWLATGVLDIRAELAAFAKSNSIEI